MPDSLPPEIQPPLPNGGCKSPEKRHLSPYVDMTRATWSALAAQTPLPLSEVELAGLKGLGEQIDLDEVQQVYLPLSRLLSMYVEGAQLLHMATSAFLGERRNATPYVIGIAGSVAVGKSTTARVLQHLLARWPNTPRVELVTTDGFLYPNAVLQERNMLHRKGFPGSYDQRALLRFVASVKSGEAEVCAPIYSHLSYDIVPGAQNIVHCPDVLIVEGLNVLQPARSRVDGRPGLAVSDFFDFSIYVDARTSDIRTWYLNRFLSLRKTAFSSPESYFHRYASMGELEAMEFAEHIWRTVNEVNLRDNVLPTRGRARLVLAKDEHHRVQRVRLRKL